MMFPSFSYYPDIDECSNDRHDCNENATCIPLDTSTASASRVSLEMDDCVQV